MDISKPLPLLAGLSPETFMRRHWQKKPLVIRGAALEATSLIDRAALFALSAQEGVESRLVVRKEDRWALRHGPVPRRAMPPIGQPGWTLLVQGVDLHVDAAHELLSRFRFVPDARLDDLMISWASDQGGVGPHVDSYDVFLLQLQGRRRWRVGPPGDASLVEGAPLKILRNFVPSEEWVLDAGDMLYLPPGWAHDGMAEGECMTASIGFRAPARQALGREVLQCMLDGAEPSESDTLYKDKAQPATAAPGRMPEGLLAFASDAAERLLREPLALACALGELMSEPKPSVWFDPGEPLEDGFGVRLDRRSRMVYDNHHVFLNGESFRAAGRDARLMQHLADRHRLEAGEVVRLSENAKELLDQWVQAGWLRQADPL
jgi:50S ribosomal protein L16 3-hydroxylase